MSGLVRPTPQNDLQCNSSICLCISSNTYSYVSIVAELGNQFDKFDSIKYMNKRLENFIFKSPRLLRHGLFWAIYITFFALVYGSFEDNYLQQFKSLVTDAVVQMPAVYLVLYYFMPKYLYKEKYTAFFSFLVPTILLFSALSWFNYVWFQDLYVWREDYDGPLMNFGKMLKSTTKIYPVMAIAVILRWFKFSYQQQKEHQTLVQEKLEAELKFLKAQIHPHFLFNTLNNLYALTLKGSKEAPDVVLRLSELLNFMLYECNADRIRLGKEIQLVKDYIELEKIRYGKKLNVSFETEGSLDDLMVAPLLILPFVENSFKHGTSTDLKQPWITIQLSREGQKMSLIVENSKQSKDTDQDQFQYKEGIGLNNVQRRLELLYPENYILEMRDQGDSYHVTFTLNVNE